MLKHFAIAPLLALIAAAPATTPTTAPADPTAQAYRKVFALIDQINESDRGKIGLCGTDGCWVVTTPLDVSTVEMLKQQRETIELIRKAVAMPPPRWQFEGDANKMVALANHAPFCSSLLVLQARQEIAENKHAQAVDDLIAALVVSRQVSSTEPTLMVKMVESLAWRPAGTELGEQLPALPKELVATLPARLAKLPKSPTTADVIRGEYAYAQMTARRQGFTVVAMVAGLRDFYKALLDGSDRTPEEFDKLVDEQLAKSANNPFAKIMAPQFKLLRRNVAALEVKQAMLETAIDVTLHGEAAALASSRDPGAAKGPFTLKKTAHGYQLISAMTDREQKRLTLQIGPADDGAAGAGLPLRGNE
jgi:hypothetical protein